MPDIASVPRVVVFGLGGTIAMTSTPSGGVVPALSAEQLVAAVPGLAETGIDVEIVDFRRVPGASLSFDDLDKLAAAIEKQLAAGADGVVVTQGTDTIEETAFFLDLSHTRPEPVVVTGAMRNPTMAGADGPANLLAAIQTAAHPTARDLGGLVVFADEIHAASRVRKTHSTSGHAFVSANGGPLGYFVEGRPQVLNKPTTRVTVPGAGTRQVEVGLVTMVLGDTGTLLRATADQFDALVVAGFGVGHVPANVVGILTELAAAKPVVLASRTGAGSVLTRTYAFPGSESDLIARGLIPAGFLDPLKARILLHRLLATGNDHNTIRAVFTGSGNA
ncbi:L-asparaginase [Actinokineospora globicatena]|uniref:asparaginase n=1 Tax=Actinokineospora globicatena TaxID=103729 RepID=UPI0020A46FEE|nr:asparaginase [Actinokineospora globicatena]MCP2304101.1 L-asparaginase [Actinokineospora globicatena]